MRSQRLTQSSTPTRHTRRLSAESYASNGEILSSAEVVVSGGSNPATPQRRSQPLQRQHFRRQYHHRSQHIQRSEPPAGATSIATSTTGTSTSVPAPRVVTPVASSQHLIQKSASWDFDGAPPEVVFVGQQGGAIPSSSCDRSVMSEMLPAGRNHGFTSYFPSDRSVLTEANIFKVPQSASFEDDDMPMDEMQDTLQVMKGRVTEVELLRFEAAASKKEIERLHQILQANPQIDTMNVDAADQGGGVGRVAAAVGHHVHANRSLSRSSGRGGRDNDDDDDVSSLGDAHDVLDDQRPHSSAMGSAGAAAGAHTAASLSRLTRAIRSSSRPPNMSAAEHDLWNAVQSSLNAVRTDFSSQQRLLERQLQESSSQHDHIQLEQSSLQHKFEQALDRIDSLEAELKQAKAASSKAVAVTPPSNDEVKRLENKLQQVEKQYQESQKLAVSQQEDHDKELRAIQRVLADISTQKDVELGKMDTKLKDLMAEKDALQQQVEQLTQNQKEEKSVEESATPVDGEGNEANLLRQEIESLQHEMEQLRNSLQLAVTERDAANQDLERKTVKISSLEREVRSAKVNLSKAAAAAAAAEQQHQQRKKEEENTAIADAAEIQKLKKELEAAHEQVKQLEARVKKEAKEEENVDNLRSLLQETVAARDAARQELERKTTRLSSVERELRAVKAKANVANAKSKSLEAEALEQSKSELASALKEVEQLKIREKDLVADVDAKGKQIRTLRRQINTVRNSKESAISASPSSDESVKVDTTALEEELAKVRKELQEKESSLENAKMIIASLENANGSLAVDLRAKLRNKDDELQQLQSEAADRKRTIDSLALELRDLQCKHVTFDNNIETRSKRQVEKHRELASELERALSELQSALVVHEAATESIGTADDPVVQQISDILCQSLAIVKASLDVYDLPDDHMDVESTFSSYIGTELTLSSELGRQVDAMIRDDREATAKGLRQELENKSSAFLRLEDAMKKHADEIKKLRHENDRLKEEREAEESRLYNEIRNLRDQCMTNMEVLTKKERELEVLRDSLKVDDGVGYISDDGSDDGDEVPPPDHVPSPPRISSSLQYGPSQAEALATLLVHGGGASVKVADGAATEEIEKLKSELTKAQAEIEKASRELKAERESLANAKMIISSLEKANKSMMEDLRKRLQDSTTAIAALVDKSMENEKVSNELRKEMEQVKREREDERVKYKADLKKYKDELLVANLRIAAKDKELEELRRIKAEMENGPKSKNASDGNVDCLVPVTTPSSSSMEVTRIEHLQLQRTQQQQRNDETYEEDAELAALTGNIDEIPSSNDDKSNNNHQKPLTEPVSAP